MPMNPRLLRPLAPSGDSDVRAYIAAVEAADTQPLEQAVKDAYRDFIVGCKADGIWDAIKASCILAGARTLAGALVPLKGSAPTNNGPFVSGDYDRETGLVGNGTSKYLDSNRANNDDPQDDNHNAVWVSVADSTGSSVRYLSDASAAGNLNNIGRSSTVANLFFRSRSPNANSADDAGASTGLIGISRGQSGSYVARASSANAIISDTSGTPTSNNVLVFSRAGAFTTNARLAFYSIGESLDLALLDSRIAALITAIGAAI